MLTIVEFITFEEQLIHFAFVNYHFISAYISLGLKTAASIFTEDLVGISYLRYLQTYPR